MDLSVFQRTVVNEDGTTLPGAQIDVYIAGTLTRPDIYSDEAGATPITNPFNADINGFAQFYIAWGNYDIVANLGGSTSTWDDVEIGRTELTGFKNHMINGNFPFWQNGEVFNSVTANAYYPDRFLIAQQGGGTITKIEKSASTFPSRIGAESALFIDGFASATDVRIQQELEDPSIYRNKTFTLSFSTNIVDYSGIGSVATSFFTDTDGVSLPITFVAQGAPVHNWQKYAASFTFADSISSNPTIRIDFTDNSKIAITKILLEPGDKATEMEYRPEGLELLLCQRFTIDLGQFIRVRASSYSADAVEFFFPSNLRTIPSVSGVEGTDWSVLTVAGAIQTGFTIAAIVQTKYGTLLRATKVAHGITDGYFRVLSANGVIFDSELY